MRLAEAIRTAGVRDESRRVVLDSDRAERCVSNRAAARQHPDLGRIRWRASFHDFPIRSLGHERHDQRAIRILSDMIHWSDRPFRGRPDHREGAARGQE